VTVHTTPERDVGLQGHYAGIASRFAAFIVDVFTVTTLFAVGGRVFEHVSTPLRGDPFLLSDAPIFSAVATAVWVFFCAYPLAVAGRTVGLRRRLRVVRAGEDLDREDAVVRVPCSAELPRVRFGFL
jgi:uncharacterized RDD family membrane protein YckC